MDSVAYVLIVVSSALGQPSVVSTHPFLDLEACEAAKHFVLENNRGVTANKDVNATCLLTQSPKAAKGAKGEEKK
jgi:hypothetical protein